MQVPARVWLSGKAPYLAYTQPLVQLPTLPPGTKKGYIYAINNNKVSLYTLMGWNSKYIVKLHVAEIFTYL